MYNVLTTVNFTSLRTCVSVMCVRKREACSESYGNNLITHTVTHHARLKRSEINSTGIGKVTIGSTDTSTTNLIRIGTHQAVSRPSAFHYLLSLIVPSM